jgi:adenylate kinase
MFITGVSGVGKTTAARQLEASSLQARRISIGDLVLKAAKREDPAVTYDQLRKDPDRFAPPRVVEVAGVLLVEDIQGSSPNANIVIESHAVVSISAGIRSTPFPPRIIQALGLDLLVLLEAGEKTIAKRLGRRGGSHSPPPLRGSAYDSMRELQRSVAVGYSILAGCPLYVISAEGSAENLSDQLRSLAGSTSIRRR